MSSESWDRLATVFFRALELPATERARFLDQACAGDAAFRREVESVLDAHLAVDASGGAEPVREEAPPAPRVSGTRIGAYALEALIGRGGMGEVYRARRADAHYEQQVAIKLMRPGRDTEALLRRFATERQILARLQHPHIATLLDGGVTAEGEPYLVMQHVEGQPITAWANTQALPLERRLGLFLTVCDAVHFAHAGLVVHRDLKPSNILVTREGDVRLLDFGIAKLLDGDTRSGATTGDLMLLTPEHAAPEQFLGGMVTTATDVYALGVLLYELLTGTRPFQLVPPLEMHRAVCEREPVAPSVAAADPRRLGEAGLERAPVAPERLRGDLDAVVLQALRKEPERRYRSVAELADDIRRHLDGFPVEARPETFGYVAGRFVRRHRTEVASAGLAAVLLLALAVVSIRSAVTSRQQAAALAVERDVAVEVSTFLEDLFRSSNPFAAGNERRDTLRIAALLEDGATKVRTELDAQPLVQARLLTALARANGNLGRHDRALPLLEDALALREAALGADDPETASTRRSLGISLWELGRGADAETALRAAVAALDAAADAPMEERIRAWEGLGNSLHAQGRFPEAEAAYRQSLDLAEAYYEGQGTELANLLSNLGTVLNKQARLDEAEPLLRRALQLQEADGGADHLRVAGALNNLGSLLLSRRDYEGAAELLERARTIVEQTMPGPHPRTAVLLNNLAVAYLQSGRVDEAEALFRHVLDLRRTLLGDAHPDVASALINLAAAVDRHGPERREEGFALKREARDRIVATLGPDHPAAATASQNLGVTLHLLDRHAEALAEYENALRIRRTALGLAHPLTANVTSKAGQCLMDLGRLDEAEARFEEAYAGFEPLKVPEAEQWRHLLGLMAELYRRTDRPLEAERMEALRDSAPG
ncbi:MAG: tetratricopeptide repeat protein [Gemmatimonadota bacterium]